MCRHVQPAVACLHPDSWHTALTHTLSAHVVKGVLLLAGHSCTDCFGQCLLIMDHYVYNIKSTASISIVRMLVPHAAGSRATVFAATDPQAPQIAASTGAYLDANAEPAQPNRRARDPKLAAWLWDWSKGQVQLPADWDVAAA